MSMQPKNGRTGGRNARRNASREWSTVELARAGLFAALTAAAAQISIPVGPVPFTLQVMATLLAGAVLGSRGGALSQAAYLVMGAVGLPVFAERAAGLHVLVGPTGGYLIGFVPAAWVVGRIMERRPEPTIGRGALAMGAGLLAIYVPGVLILTAHLGSLGGAVAAGVLPFLWLDALKAGAAYVVAKGLFARGIVRPTTGAGA